MNIYLSNCIVSTTCTIGDAWKFVLNSGADRTCAIEYFLGRLEEAVGFMLPQWWVEIARALEIRSQHPFFPLPNRKVKSEFQKNFQWRMSPHDNSSFLASTELDIKKTASHVEIIRRGTSFKIPNVKSCKVARGFVCGTELLVTFPTSRPEPFQFTKFDLRTGKEAWSSVVLESHLPTPLGGRSCHYLDVIADDTELVWVFGFGPETIYVESFRLADGKPEFRFNAAKLIDAEACECGSAIK